MRGSSVAPADWSSMAENSSPRRYADQAVGGQAHGRLEVAVDEAGDARRDPSSPPAPACCRPRRPGAHGSGSSSLLQPACVAVTSSSTASERAAPPAVVAFQRGRQQHVDGGAVGGARTGTPRARNGRCGRTAGSTTSRACCLRRRREEVGRHPADHLAALVAHQPQPAVAHVEDAAVRADGMQDGRRGFVEAAHAQLALGPGGWWSTSSWRRWVSMAATIAARLLSASCAGARRAGAACTVDHAHGADALASGHARWARPRRSARPDGRRDVERMGRRSGGSLRRHRGTSNSASPRIAWSQNATSRGVSVDAGQADVGLEPPALRVDRARSARSARRTVAPRCVVMVSKAASGGVSSTPNSRSAATRRVSLTVRKGSVVIGRVPPRPDRPAAAVPAR